MDTPSHVAPVEKGPYYFYDDAQDALWDQLGCVDLLRPYDKTNWMNYKFKDPIRDVKNEFFVVLQNASQCGETWQYFWPVDSSSKVGPWYYHPAGYLPRKAECRLIPDPPEGQTVTVKGCTFSVQPIAGHQGAAKLVRVPQKIEHLE